MLLKKYEKAKSVVHREVLHEVTSISHTWLVVLLRWGFRVHTERCGEEWASRHRFLWCRWRSAQLGWPCRTAGCPASWLSPHECVPGHRTHCYRTCVHGTVSSTGLCVSGTVPLGSTPAARWGRGRRWGWPGNTCRPPLGSQRTAGKCPDSPAASDAPARNIFKI